VLVVVCLPEFKACEISPVSARALGTNALTKVLLPAPEGPRIKSGFSLHGSQQGFQAFIRCPIWHFLIQAAIPRSSCVGKRLSAATLGQKVCPKSLLFKTIKGLMCSASAAIKARESCVSENSGSAAKRIKILV
jgi:hypothetical protein